MTLFFLYILTLVLVIGVSLPYVMLFCIARLIISKVFYVLPDGLDGVLELDQKTDKQVQAQGH